MALQLTPILIQHEPATPNKQQALTLLSQWGLETQRIVATYPAQRGRGRYRRSGNLGRSWTSRQVPTVDGVSQEVSNAVRSNKGAAYASKVEGFVTQDPRQTQDMANRGWPSAETVSQQTWAKYRPAIVKAIQGR